MDETDRLEAEEAAGARTDTALRPLRSTRARCEAATPAAASVSCAPVMDEGTEPCRGKGRCDREGLCGIALRHFTV